MLDPDAGCSRDDEINPYASPRSSVIPQIPYYREDSRRISCAEYWRLSPSMIGFLVMVILKLLHVPFNFGQCIFYPGTIRRLSQEDLPPEAVLVLDRNIDEWIRQRFRFLFYYTCSATRTRGCQTYAAAMISDDATVLSTVVYVYVEPKAAGDVPTKKLNNQCFSRFSDGVYRTVMDSRKYFNPVPESRPIYLPGRSIAEIYGCHRQSLTELPAVPLRFAENAVEEFLKRLENRWIEHQIARGVLIPMSPEEMAAAGGLEMRTPDAPTGTQPPVVLE